MLLPISWLRSLVDLDGVSNDVIEKSLFSCGLEVEEKRPAAPDISGVVVGVIRETAPHTDSDHLTVCRLDCGEYGDNIQIVTGASNIKTGDHVPVALQGATVYGRDGSVVTIRNGKLRGVASNGMLCSGEELGITDDWYPGASVYGILQLDHDTVPGTDVLSVLALDDEIWDISVTANLPHCQYVYGVARELAALLDRAVRMPDLTYTAKEIRRDDIRVTVEAPDLCPRYIAHYVSDVKVTPSPLWMRRRLLLCDHKPFNNIVDITNYVLTEMGQPLHAFDLSTLSGAQIVVRRAKEKEEITTLDGATFSLSTENLVICDKEKPVALAGIMGGQNSEIRPTTHEVLFESAKFMRDNIRRTSRALGQNSDSSRRFEKGVDEYTTNLAMCRVLHLIEELGCGTVSSTHLDVCADPDKKNQPITTTFSRINSVLGIEVPTETIRSILTRMEYTLTVDGDTVTAVAPPYREDVDSFPDLAEDVIKMYGYEHIVPRLMEGCAITAGGLSRAQEQAHRVKEALVSDGFCETINYAFYSMRELTRLRLPADDVRMDPVRIQNPLGEPYSVLRTTLVPTLITLLSHNAQKGNDGARLFELARVFAPTSGLPEERMTLTLGMYGPDESFFTMKGAIEAIAASMRVSFTYERAEQPFLHPGITARILCEGEEVGYLGQVAYEVAEDFHMDVPAYVAELDYVKLAAHFPASLLYTPVPKHPTVSRDLALVADEKMTCAEIESVIRSACKVCTAVTLFDVYRSAQIGEGKKSMAFRLTFTPTETPLSSEEVDKFIEKILKSLSHRLGLTIR